MNSGFFFFFNCGDSVNSVFFLIEGWAVFFIDLGKCQALRTGFEESVLEIAYLPPKK